MPRRLAGPGLLTSPGPRSIGVLWLSGKVNGRLPAGRRRSPAGTSAQVPVHHRLLRVVTDRFVACAHRRGIEVHALTIDSAAQTDELLDLGVDGVVTDRPDVLREVLRERGAWPATV